MPPHVARLIGGAGTGKTTELLSIMQQVIERGHLAPEEIGFVSFTRAARTEAAQRAAAAFGCAETLLTKGGWFRTLHSVCYQAVGSRGELLVPGEKDSDAWLSEALGVEAGVPSEAIGDDWSEPNTYQEQTPTDIALHLWSRSRNLLVPLEDCVLEAYRASAKVPRVETARKIVEDYEEAKQLDGRIDFTDLLGLFAGVKFSLDGPEDIDPIGEVPALPVWFFDEQQDTSPLLDRVCHRLIGSDACRWVYVSGDPFQGIYGWAGCEPQLFMRWRADKQRVLDKSYRCAAPILETGELCLRGCSDYWDRGIRPADHGGEVESRFCDARFAADVVRGDEDWLVLGRSHYHASRVASHLTRNGVPWTSTKSGGWMRPSATVACNALLALQRGYPIGWPEWSRVIHEINAKCPEGELLLRGTKSRWIDKDFRPGREIATLDELPEWGCAPLLAERISSGAWVEMIAKAPDFVSAHDRYGELVAMEPRVRVGTIHSVKGAEADNVLVLATTSRVVGEAAKASQSIADEERRLAYVAATRARKRLVLVREPSAEHYMKFWG